MQSFALSKIKFVDNGVMTTPKRMILSFIFTVSYLFFGDELVDNQSQERLRSG